MKGKCTSSCQDTSECPIQDINVKNTFKKDKIKVN